MSKDVNQEFGDFFLDIYHKYLSKNSVVKIEGLGYFWIFREEGRIAKFFLEVKKEIPLPSRIRLAYYQITTKDTIHDDFTESELLDSLKKNDIHYIVVEFPMLGQLLSQFKVKLDPGNASERILISSSQGQALFEMYVRYPKQRMAINQKGERFPIQPPLEIHIWEVGFLRDLLQEIKIVDLIVEEYWDEERLVERSRGLTKKSKLNIN